MSDQGGGAGSRSSRTRTRAASAANGRGGGCWASGLSALSSSRAARRTVWCTRATVGPSAPSWTGQAVHGGVGVGGAGATVGDDTGAGLERPWEATMAGFRARRGGTAAGTGSGDAAVAGRLVPRPGLVGAVAAAAAAYDSGGVGAVATPTVGTVAGGAA